MTKEVRIRVRGRISGHAAAELGGRVEATSEGSLLVAPYVDQPQLTGLLVQLCDLHLGFDHVAIEPAGASAGHRHEGAIR